MKRAIFSLILVALGITTLGQVEKTIIVEHFTNTRCGICASKNPGFYQNLANHPNIIHLAIHPSSPYSNCALHLDNPADNDGRTNYYNVYGGTPRLVIQGEPQSFSINMSSPSIFDLFEGQTCPFSMKITEYRMEGESVQAEVTIKATVSHNMTAAKLFLAYAEDTVFYQAPNGENEHYDVFRKAFTPVGGDPVTLPAEGDSIVMNYTIAFDQDWDPDRMFAIGILQDNATKQVIQADQTFSVEYPSSIFNHKNNHGGQVSFYPNPATSQIILRDVSGRIEIVSLVGRLINSLDAGNIPTDMIMDISTLETGTYLLRNHRNTSLLIKQ